MMKTSHCENAITMEVGKDSPSMKEERAKPDPYIGLKLKCTFCVLGVSIAFGWNAMINALAAIRDVLLYEPGKKPIMTSPITCLYNVAVFLASLLFARTGASKKWFLYGGIIASFCFVVIFVIITLVAKGVVALVLLILASVGLGGAVATTMTATFSFAAKVEPYIHRVTDAAQTGIGVAGLLSFAVWILLSRAVFHFGSELGNLRAAILGMIVLCLIITVTALYCASLVFPERIIPIVMANRELEKDLEDECKMTIHSSPCAEMECRSTPTQSGTDTQNAIEVSSSGVLEEVEPWSHWKLLKATGMTVLNMAATMFITFMLFPSIAPLQWKNLTVADFDFRTGSFQVTNFIGRGLPLFVGILHKTPRWIIYIFVWGRFVFYPWFYCFDLSTANQLIYMVLLGITSGVLITVEAAHLVTISKEGGPTARSVAASWGVSGLIGGTALGTLIVVGLTT